MFKWNSRGYNGIRILSRWKEGQGCSCDRKVCDWMLANPSLLKLLNARATANRFILPRVTMQWIPEWKRSTERSYSLWIWAPEQIGTVVIEMILPEICLGLFSEAYWCPTSAVGFQVTQSCPALPARERLCHLKAVNLWLDPPPHKGCAWSFMSRCSSDPVPLPKPVFLSFSDW